LPGFSLLRIVYYETIKRELNKRLIYECRSNERLKAKAERSTRLAYTVLRGGQEHLKIKTKEENNARVVLCRRKISQEQSCAATAAWSRFLQRDGRVREGTILFLGKQYCHTYRIQEKEFSFNEGKFFLYRTPRRSTVRDGF
jgi:hypothetical protein